MKKLKKISLLFLVMSMFIINLQPVFASSYKLNIEKESADIKYLDDNQGYISKKIIDSDLENGEVTVELTVSNSKQASNDKTLDNPEIMIVLDNSISMSYLTPSGNIRKKEILNATRQLINSIYSANSSSKVGLVRFAAYRAGSNYSCDVDDDGTIDMDYIEDVCSEGKTSFYYSQDNAAILMQALTTDKNSILQSVSNLENLKTPYIYGTEAGTDIAAGLQVAYNSFSGKSNNKTIILITDGVPTGYFGSTESLYYKTNSYIKTIAEDSNLITILTGLSESDDAGDDDTVKATFGTVENPSADKYYNISDTSLSKTITEDVLNDVKEYIQTNMTNVTITDYFPSDIKDNFEFSYVTKPTTGTITEKISDDNTITYTLNELKANESVTISYKLKLKENASTKILDKVINTNEKVVLNYTDSTSTEKEVILTSSPSIKLVKVDEPTTPEENVEEVVENPPTGLYVSLSLLSILVIGIIGFIGLRRKNYFNKI